MGRTLFEKIWDAHVIRALPGGWDLIHIDRPLLHDLVGPDALAQLRTRGLKVHNPELVFATIDHTVTTRPGRTNEAPGPHVEKARSEAAAAAIAFFDVGRQGQGIVHVTAPELGIVLPGTTAVCGDSHTCTNGGLGALAFGVGSSEILHVLATQTLRQRRPRQMRIVCTGQLDAAVSAKELALHIIRQLSARAGIGYAVEFAGPAVTALDIEGRLTLCNMSVELGARCGMVAPDEKTVRYLQGGAYAPKDDAFDLAASHWLSLQSDEDVVFDAEFTVRADEVAPMVTWGTNPEQAIRIDERIPDPSAQGPGAELGIQDALDYMGLEANTPIEGTAIDWVFIGSCANARLTDLRSAAAVVQGRHVADGVTAWVVPGSEKVKQAAEQEGLRQVFESAGFVWREPGCSMCVAANGERVPPGQRSISTSNRNFVGRQGPGARTHLASPAMAAAAAIAGHITDVRNL
ncbi:3-isopropylmalate dehydratase large subunit [Variovorax sp. PBS-H4]|uniref:3-isopropylmalate dehydratase large subunit n=1 Tax=Variovorax sp. PBS-H4 TaxID=434008 RepID=UPI0013161BE1|nr:3-isopropylmalate dehydratase large subunit [Variovorax sp. PBS-H4]VTU41317.1 3-isopropylmalate dehydratase large subunit [Variovorax sp. PBS-H4]